MRNIWNIFTHDLKKLGSSIVVMITILGLSIIPCLYAWFNIFSNWAPYESDATGRIAVAVANEDTGAGMLGLKINVGESIVSALKANEDIGWVFIDSKEEAIEGVYAGDYYAALIVPETFSNDVMSFLTGDFDNPTLYYYENEKKNAIAPKITGKAEEAVRKEVNATFLETLAKYISEAASIADATGLDPSIVFGDLADQMDLLSDKLDSAVAIVNASISLSEAAANLMAISDSLIDDTEDTVTVGQEILDVVAEGIPDEGIDVESSLTAEIRQLRDNLSRITADFDNLRDNMDLYNEYIEGDLDSRLELVNEMKDSSDSVASNLEAMGLTTLAEQFRNISSDLSDLSDQMSGLETADEETWEQTQGNIDNIQSSSDQTSENLDKINTDVTTSPEKTFNEAIKEAKTAVVSIRNSLDGTYDNLELLVEVLAAYEGSLEDLEKGLGKTTASVLSMQAGLRNLSDLFDTLANSDLVSDINSLITDDSEAIASYLASPVKMDTEVIWPVNEYGSAMAPFYTVLAQWVGALLTAVLIKTNVKKRDDLPDLRLHQKFFGRYGLYLIVGIAQALIVSLGDLLYVGIQCLHPVRFVLAACMNGITFMMINYALVFALDNIGLGAAVIVLVLQVAGSGGTYPVEVLPDIFKVIYPVMPFKYSMDAMRECIAGMYGNTYSHCMLVLALMVLVAIAFGLLLYYPALWLNKLIAQSKKNSDIML